MTAFEPKTEKTETIAAPTAVETVAVAFARQELAVNTEVTEKNFDDLFELKEVPVAVAPEAAVKGKASLKDAKYLRLPVAEGAMMVASMLSKDLTGVEAPAAPVARAPLYQHVVVQVNGLETVKLYYEGKDPRYLRPVEKPSEGTTPLTSAVMQQFADKPTETSDESGR